ncbi:branched-chain amino acid ABC transporter permease [Paracoccus jeotgali]|uniref:Branched-chain amino acid ABC transporter permease n=1 Tax=Paracoccus jeotgali TaxID=2065379 RepID=A0A2K9MJC2_9RHOB|nr:branched-chain amino acid ABC transporter permease [Paracoccus jeotgali]AUM75749.1 branched-chain amino acid ABC transporter permease [Paracoccus jeotgali]
MGKRLAYGLSFGAMLFAPMAVYPIFLMNVLVFALFACAFNLLLGFAGLLSFGHAAFFGWSAYITGHMLMEMNWPPLAGILAGTVAGGSIGLIVGALSIRRQGIYFTMVTLALAQMMYFLALQMDFTRGEDGLQGVPRGSLFGLIDLGNDLNMYYFVLAVFVGGYALIVRTVHSPFGQVLKAIKENEPRAISLGYKVERYKLLAFVLSAALAALAGATKTVVLGFATLTDVHWMMSGTVVLMTLVGGMGTLIGPVIGAAAIIFLEYRLDWLGKMLAASTNINWFARLGDSATVVIGCVFVVCVLAFRRGVAGEAKAYWARRTVTEQLL